MARTKIIRKKTKKKSDRTLKSQAKVDYNPHRWNRIFNINEIYELCGY